MTVLELLKELEGCYEDAEVIVENDELYLSGQYVATSVFREDDDHVFIQTDHKRKVKEYD